MSADDAGHADAELAPGAVAVHSCTVDSTADDAEDSVSKAAAPPAANPTAVPPLPLLQRLWLLVLITLVYLVLNAQRWSLSVVARPLEASLHFGDGSGHDSSFQLLAGPAFTLLFAGGGVVVSVAVTRWNVNRSWMLATNLLLATAGCVCAGVSRNFGALAASRALQGISQAGSGSFSAALLGAAFPPQERGKAFSVYNFGVYAGYGSAFAFANAMHATHVESTRWREMFLLLAIPSAALAVLILLTVRDREWDARRKMQQVANASLRTPLLPSDAEVSHAEHLQLPASASTADMSTPLTSPLASESDLVESPSAAPASSAPSSRPRGLSLVQCFVLLFRTPALLVLCAASTLRNAGGIVWGNDTEQFFETYRHLSPNYISSYMSWIPMVFGSAGALLGGWASDALLARWGRRAQVGLLVVSQLTSAPLALLVLLLPAPAAFIADGAYLLAGEGYIGVCYALLMDFAPPEAHTFIIAVYLFFLANLGGNAGLLLPPMQRALGGDLMKALAVLWPGAIAAAAVGYAMLWKWAKPKQNNKQ